MTKNEKKVLLNALDTAYYQVFSYRKQNKEVESMQAQYHADKLATICKSLGLSKEVHSIIIYWFMERNEKKMSELLKEVIKYIRKQEVLSVTNPNEYIYISYFDSEYKRVRIVYDKKVYSFVCMRLKPVITASFDRMIVINSKHKRKDLTLKEQYAILKA